MYGKVYDVAIGNTPYSREGERQKEPNIRKALLSRAFPMRPSGLEPPRTVKSTRPSTLRVYQFRHGRRGASIAPGMR